MIGAENIKSPLAAVRGIETSVDSIRFHLKKPYTKLLELFSFGLYSIVHPDDYEAMTGVWKNSAKVIAGNAYRVKQWTSDFLILEKREIFPAELQHPHALQSIKINWNPRADESADLFEGASNNVSISSVFKFHGATPSNIAYVHCLSWNKPGSICHSRDMRIAARTALYEKFIKNGVKVTRSFFPPGIVGISEPQLNDGHDQELKIPIGTKVSFRLMSPGNFMFEAFNNYFSQVIVDRSAIPAGLKIQPSDLIIDSTQAKQEIDYAGLATGILIEDPRADIRFMFLSKEGIRLPDTDGRIHEELKNENFSPQKINELLWDQAVIWPLGHYASGIWAKDEFDLSMLNTILPPVEFQWIG